MNITVVGTGYVGVVTAACFAEFGLQVVGVDKDDAKIDLLQKGQVPFFEPGLEEMVRRNMREDRLAFSTDLKAAVEKSLVILIAVGTPLGDGGAADLGSVKEVVLGIARCMNGYKVIVTKSTVPMGTGAMIRGLIEGNQSQNVPFSVASNPEFLREGAAIEDFMRPNRVVIGAEDPQAIAIMKDLYKPLFLIETPFVITNVVSAEMIKYASNAFLATKISFINEIARLCEAVGADVHEVARGMGLDNRIGRKFLHPGPGFGGSCFPKDTHAVVKMAGERGVPARIVQAAIEVNRHQVGWMVEKITRAVGGLKGRTIACLGLSFKPNTSDTRDSPAIRIIQELLKGGARVRAYDPAAMQEARHALPDVAFAEDAYDAARGCDALVIVTEWNQFRSLDWERIKTTLNSPTVVDLRNVYEPDQMKRLGIAYTGVGR
ncbi:MAG TPA: UDP-glucose/GDP-mannose dehydrogenase family protein [Candidatus Dormibacteraeota bacterium]|nr:UDP-glucose/GDP-mannose dehydrogenase family protein [Candidatus Dormibacteraeota bacterium]